LDLGLQSFDSSFGGDGSILLILKFKLQTINLLNLTLLLEQGIFGLQLLNLLVVSCFQLTNLLLTLLLCLSQLLLDVNNVVVGCLDALLVQLSLLHDLLLKLSIFSDQPVDMLCLCLYCGLKRLLLL
jgi:hypothetical protein